MLNSTAKVHLILFLTMMVWGLNLSAVKVLTETLDVLLVAAVRMAMAVIVLSVLAWRWGYSSRQWNISEWKYLGLAAIFLVYSQQIVFAGGLARTSATNASLVMALGPSVSLALEAATFRRPVRFAQIVGVFCSLFGVAAVVLHRPNAALSEAAFGDVLVFLSVLFFAIGGLYVQRLTRKASPLTVSLLIHLLGAILLWMHVGVTVTNPIEQVMAMGRWQWGMAAFSAVLATGIGSVIWSKGISAIGVGQTASYLSWVPIFGVSFGSIFLGEPVTIWHAVGLVAVIFGSLLVVRNRPLNQ